MSRTNKVSIICATLVVVLLAGSIFGRLQAEQIRGNQATLEETLYLPSGKTLKKLSLGYYSLLADVYWTRAVQYFGEHHIGGTQHYELLYPLLQITTDLDPNLIVAYENGSIFLSQHKPDGAGESDKAVALVEKGIRNNPEYWRLCRSSWRRSRQYWRLYFTLGFIHYTDRHDSKSAQQAFQKGSEVPGALPWMKVMAARMAEHADDTATAYTLWKTIYDNTYDKDIKFTAAKHLLSLRVDAELTELEKRTQTYYERHGAYPEQWSDLVRDGLLPGIPADPNGAPYQLRLDGTVRVQDPKQFPYLEGHHASK